VKHFINWIGKDPKILTGEAENKVSAGMKMRERRIRRILRASKSFCKTPGLQNTRLKTDWGAFGASIVIMILKFPE